MTRSCEFEGCGRKYVARGYCGGHYRQLSDGRDLSPLERKALTADQRYWQKVEKGGPSDCWKWVGSTNSLGYGLIRIGKGPTPAHRYAYTLANGPILDGLVIDHVCHNPSCVNPAHLQAVTQKQNGENLIENRSNNSSGYRGVHWHKASGKWVGAVFTRGKTHYLGTFTDINDAAAAVRAKRNELFTNNILDWQKTA